MIRRPTMAKTAMTRASARGLARSNADSSPAAPVCDVPRSPIEPSPSPPARSGLLFGDRLPRLRPRPQLAGQRGGGELIGLVAATRPQTARLPASGRVASHRRSVAHAQLVHELALGHDAHRRRRRIRARMQRPPQLFRQAVGGRDANPRRSPSANANRARSAAGYKTSLPYRHRLCWTFGAPLTSEIRRPAPPPPPKSSENVGNQKGWRDRNHRDTLMTAQAHDRAKAQPGGGKPP